MDNQRDSYKVRAKLNREELDFIDKISKDAMYKNGKSIPRSEAIKAIVEAVRKIGGLSGQNINSPEMLEELLRRIVKKSMKSFSDELNNKIDKKDK